MCVVFGAVCPTVVARERVSKLRIVCCCWIRRKTLATDIHFALNPTLKLHVSCVTAEFFFCARADCFFETFQTVVHSTVLRGFSQALIYALHAALVACCRFLACTSREAPTRPAAPRSAGGYAGWPLRGQLGNSCSLSAPHFFGARL